MSPTPPSATDPATAAYEYTVHFEPRDIGDAPDEGASITIITDSTDRNAVREQARARLQNQLGVGHAEEVEAGYRIDRTRVAFYDAPWDSFDDLQAALESIDGIRNTVYISPMTGAYEPSQFWLQVSDGVDDTDVVAAVKEYYPGLTSRIESDGVYVVISAIN